MRPAALLVLALAVACSPSRRDEPSDDQSPDAGTPLDAGSPEDAGDPEIDAGVVDPDAGAPIPGPCEETGTATTDARAYESLLACLESAAASARKDAAIGTFFAAVESRGGLPIDAGASVVFAGTSEGAPSIAGDFDAWRGTATVAHGNGFWSLRITIPRDEREGAKYKLVRAGTFGPDPLARRFQFDAFDEFSLVRGSATDSHLERIPRVHATRLDDDRPIYVYVPAGYDTGAARFPVLYLHDGQNVFDTRLPGAVAASWDVDAIADEEISSGRARPFLMVAVPNTARRFDEYTLTTDDIGSRVGGRAADYGHFLVTDVKPLVDGRYRTLSDRANTSVAGSSLGGLVSFELALLHPTVFGGVAGLSSTFAWGALGESNPTVIDRYRAAALDPAALRLYLDSGGGAPDGCATADPEDTDNYCTTLEMKDLLVSKGFSTFPDDPDALHFTPAGANILHWWEPGAPHFETAWNARFFRVVRFLFGT